MKVLHVTRRFNEDKWGGIESVVWNLADQYQKKQVQTEILSTSMFSNPGLDHIREVPVRRFDYSFPFFGLSEEDKQQMALKGGSPLCKEMLKFLKSQKDLSIIHTHVLHRMGGIARTAAAALGIPYVVSIHGGHLTLASDEAERLQAPSKGKLEWGKFYGWLWGSRRVLKEADAIICVGQDEYKRMQKAYPQTKVIYQPNGVDVEKFKSVRKTSDFKQQIDLKEGEKLILCVSRLDPQKNQLLLLETFAEYLKNAPNSRLCLIGSATNQNYYQKLESRVNTLGLENKVNIICGYDFGDDRLIQAYQSADIFVLPSVHEPFGIVILEAWASGVPVIATDIGGISGFTENEKNILHFSKNNHQQLLDRLVALENEELRQKLIDKASAEVKKYSWESVAQSHVELYQKLIDLKKK